MEDFYIKEKTNSEFKQSKINSEEYRSTFTSVSVFHHYQGQQILVMNLPELKWLEMDSVAIHKSSENIFCD